MDVRIGLLGAGGQASETESYLPSGAVIFRAVNLNAREPAAGLVDIETVRPEYLETPVNAAVGAPGLRQRLVDHWGGATFHTVIAEGAVVARTATVGDGSTLAPGAVLTAGASTGRHVILNVGASLSHSSSVGDFVTLSPGARIAGDCVVGDGVFLGVGAVVSHGLSLASGVVVGAGATVLRDLTEPGVYIGTPARLLRPLSGWLLAL